MWLGLESDTYVLDRTAEHGVCKTGEGAGEIVLAIAEGLSCVDAGYQGGWRGVVAGFEEAAGEVEATELNGDLNSISPAIYTMMEESVSGGHTQAPMPIRGVSVPL